MTWNSESTYHSHHLQPIHREKSKTRFGVPSLVDYCANLLAVHDHSFRRVQDLPPILETLLRRPTYYYVQSEEDLCSRRAKRSTALSKHKVYLANTTLVVVPQILIKQWMHEISKHVEEGGLRVLEVGREELGEIEDLMEYDVCGYVGPGIR
jgi:hypothetical protein